MKVLPESGLYRERARACLSGFSDSFSFFGLFGSFGPNNGINQTNKIDQTDLLNPSPRSQYWGQEKGPGYLF